MLRATGLYAGVTSVVKVVAFAKEALVASAFGVSGEMDVYVMGFLLIGIPAGILINAVQTAFIPTFVEMRAVGNQGEGAAFLSAVISGTLVVLMVILAIWLIILPWVIETVGHGFEPLKQRHVRQTVLLLIPYYFINAVNLVGQGALQSDKRFLASSIFPVCIPATTMVIVLFAGGGDIRLLVLGIVIGALFEFLAINRSLMRVGLSLKPGGLKISRDIIKIARSSAVLLLGSLMACFAPAIEQGIASGLAEGTISAMAYAYKLPATISGILVTAVGVTVLPFFAEKLVQGRRAECQTAFRNYAIVLAIGGGSMSFILAAMSEPIVDVLFQRGEFTQSDTVFVAGIQRVYFFQIPATLVSMLAVRLLIAQGAYGIVSIVTSLSVLLSGGVAWILSSHYNAPGIAMGFAIGTTVGAFVLVGLAWTRFETGDEITTVANYMSSKSELTRRP